MYSKMSKLDPGIIAHTIIHSTMETLGRQRQMTLWVPGQPGLDGETLS